MAAPKTVGVLALQGDFEAHGRALSQAGARPVYVRTADQLREIDGLVLPGGESTTMLKLLNIENMKEPLAEFAREKPVLATCAGVILMAREVSHPVQECLGILDLAVERNGYGRQIDSRIVELDPSEDFLSRTGAGKLEAVFIRAPVIQNVGPKGRVLASYLGRPVLVEQDQHLAVTFHPELTSDNRVHQLFLKKL
ncbi:MAG: glutamine amidotransferase [Bryobacterales bacterium]|nr:glutamine amidotransferase [Bryobacterales bacterium]